MDMEVKNHMNRIDQNRVTLEQAIQLIHQNTGRLSMIELPLYEVSGEVLAVDVTASFNQPPFPRSPLDGYALKGRDTKGANAGDPAVLNVIGKVCAGEFFDGEIREKECVRIMTGAPIPRGADAVVRQEDTDYAEDSVRVYREVDPGANYCHEGEDFQKGQTLIHYGTVLDFTAIAVIAENGLDRVPVYRKPVIALISTGSELAEPGERLEPGKIYNSNAYMLRARLRELGISCRMLRVNDNEAEVCQVIEESMKWADAVITTGGVSVGERDVMNRVLEQLGAEILFHGVKMKPGSPAKFAIYNGRPILALSGNPFAAAATFELLGRPMIGSLMGSSTIECVKTRAILNGRFRKRSGMRRFIRGIYKEGEVLIPQAHSSGQLFSMLGCNCLVDIPEGTPELQNQQEIDILIL